MKLLKFVGQNAVINFITYTIMGLLAANILGYEEIWKESLEGYGYRAFDSTWVMLGPVLQPIRGAVYGLILWPFRNTILKSKFGWLKLFGLFWGIGIFGTFAAAIGSFEGVIYTAHPFTRHIWGQPEITGHALLYSFLLFKLEDENPNRIKTGIKAVSIAFVSKVIYIALSLISAGITGTGTGQENVSSVLYIALILSSIILIVVVYMFLNKPLNKLKMFLVLFAAIAGPYILVSFIFGTTIIGVFLTLITCSIAALPAMALTSKLS